MTTLVTMLQTRRGEDGTQWSAGSSYYASDAFATTLITSNLATGVLPAVPQSQVTVAQMAALQASARSSNADLRPPVRDWVNLVSTTDAAIWDDRAGSGMTVSVDSNVRFDGQPSLRIDIPANSSGTYRVGTSAANVVMPYNWAGKQLVWAVMSSNIDAAVSGSVLLGDSSFTNFNAHGGQIIPANVPEAQWQSGEWMVCRGTVVSPTGSPTYPGIKRLRFNATVTSQPTPTTVWLGMIGIARQKRPTIIVSVDDGYRSGYSFLAALCRYYRIPVSFGIDRFYVGAAGYLTEAMIRELHADPSDLFEFVTHGYANTNVSVAGDAAYVQQQIDTRAYLRSLGIDGDGPNHHPWVQSIYTNAAVTGLRAAGFLSGRAGGSTPKSMHDTIYATGHDKRVFHQLNCTTLTTGLSLAQAQTAITSACTTEGYGVAHVNAHDFAAADAANPPTWAHDKMHDLMGWMAAQRDAGVFDVKCWGRWYADLIGAVYTK